MKSFARRLAEISGLQSPPAKSQQPMPNKSSPLRVMSKKPLNLNEQIDNFQKNFEDLQNTLKMLGSQRRHVNRVLSQQKEKQPEIDNTPLKSIQKSNLSNMPRTSEKDVTKRLPEKAKFFQNDKNLLSKSVVLEGTPPRKGSTPTSQTDSRLKKFSSFSSRISGQNGHRIPKVGLPNIGNTCYINATLQCLFHLPNFNRLFESQDIQDYLNSKNRGSAVKYSELYRKVTQGTTNPEELSTFGLKRAVSKKCSLFIQWNQEDAHQFTQQLLDSLHEDLNRIQSRPEYRQLEADRKIRVLTSLSNEYWSYYRRRDDSHITDYFCGQVLSSVVCQGCSSQSLSFDNYLDLSLPMLKGMKSLEQLIDNFLKIEQLKDLYNCSGCRKMNKCTRKLELWRAPKILMIQLKRFKYGRLTHQKIKQKLRFPVEGLNFRPFMKTSSNFLMNVARRQFSCLGTV